MARRQVLDGVELIEIVDPSDPDVRWDVHAWEPGSAPAPEPDHRARWGLVAVAALVAVVWGAVAWFDRPDPPPPPAEAEGRYVLDAEGFPTYSADVVGDRTAGRSFGLWSDREAGATLTVTATKGEHQPLLLAAEAVEEVDGQSLVRTVDARGRMQLTAETELGDDWWAVVTGYGLSPEDVAGAARAVRVGDGDQPVVELFDPLSPVLPRLSRVLTGVDPEHQVRGGVDSILRYHDAAGDEYTLTVAQGEAADGLPRARDALQWLAAEAPVDADGAVAARRADDAIAVWTSGDDLLALSGPARPDDLVRLAASVRPALAEEWVALLYGLHPDRRLGEADVIDASTDALGRWTGGVQRVEQGGATTLQWLLTEPGDPRNVRSAPAKLLPPTGFSAETFVVEGVTYVFVQATPEVAADGVLVVQQPVGETGPPVIRPLRLTRAYLDDDTLMGVTRVLGPGVVGVQRGGS